MNTPTITALDVRVVNPPLKVPHATAGGVVASFPMVLLDLRTSDGTTGCAYVFPYTMVAAPSVARLLRDLAGLLVGQPCAPLLLEPMLRRRFRLLGPHGFTAIAMAAVDMAAWDVVCRRSGLPLYAQLGGVARGSRAYAPVGLSGPEDSVREARAGIDAGFNGVKAKIGYPSVDEDITVLRALRDAIGPRAALMCDYNQALDVPEAMRRGRALDAVPGLDLVWIEEPTTAEDFSGHAQVKAQVRTPIQAGENWWGALEFRKAIDAGATDLLMPDVMKSGGITGWLKIAALAEAHALPVSNHLFPEVSAQLMCVTPTAGWFEWADWSSPVLTRPVDVRDGQVWPSGAPGIGLEWDEAAVAQHRVKGA